MAVIGVILILHPFMLAQEFYLTFSLEENDE